MTTRRGANPLCQEKEKNIRNDNEERDGACATLSMCGRQIYAPPASSLERLNASRCAMSASHDITHPGSTYGHALQRVGKVLQDHGPGISKPFDGLLLI